MRASTADGVPHGWLSVIESLLSLHDRRLLPPELCADETFGVCWDEPLVALSSAQPIKTQSSFSFSGWVGYLIGSADATEAEERAKRVAETNARKEVHACAHA